MTDAMIVPASQTDVLTRREPVSGSAYLELSVRGSRPIPDTPHGAQDTSGAPASLPEGPITERPNSLLSRDFDVESEPTLPSIPAPPLLPTTALARPRTEPKVVERVALGFVHVVVALLATIALLLSVMLVLLIKLLGILGTVAGHGAF